ncbi:MAG: hypothetical protein CM15mP77_2680 [Synechococcus sp.]|nr:MAG: hypothetical protein CM15mP77_2680 [Synechococcus sp.]
MGPLNPPHAGSAGSPARWWAHGAPGPGAHQIESAWFPDGNLEPKVFFPKANPPKGPLGRFLNPGGNPPTGTGEHRCRWPFPLTSAMWLMGSFWACRWMEAPGPPGVTWGCRGRVRLGLDQVVSLPSPGPRWACLGLKCDVDPTDKIDGPPAAAVTPSTGGRSSGKPDPKRGFEYGSGWPRSSSLFPPRPAKGAIKVRGFCPRCSCKGGSNRGDAFGKGGSHA